MNVLDLFSGIGGFSLGLERAGMRTAAFCEVDKKARAVLRKHWPTTPIFNDVKTLSAKDINETIDVICGGFPCQDISLAGKGAGLAGERSGLWFEFHRLIAEIQPRYAIIENVSALRSRGLDEVLRSLAEIGYDAEWHCIPSAAVGAPHQRDRIWVAAYRSGLGWDERHGGRLGGHLLHHIERFTTESEQERNRWQRGARAARAPQHGPIIASWEAQSGVLGVADGVPNWAHRIKQLGNAVVPQIPELIGRAIVSFESHLKAVNDNIKE